MRLTIIFFMIFHLTVKGADDRLIAMKKEITGFYDSGKSDRAVSRLKTLALSSGPDAFVVWLNIAVIESERYNREQAEEALRKAALINSSGKSYIFSCRKIISGESLNYGRQLIAKYGSISDPLEKLLIWQFLYYSLSKEKLAEVNDFREVLSFLGKDLKRSSLRYAKILSAGSLLCYRNDDEETRVNRLIVSNLLLDSLGYSRSTLFVRNVRDLFYLSQQKGSRQYSDYLLKYQKDPFLMKFKEIQTAVYYYKAKYFFLDGNLNQSLFFCRKAYAADPEDQNVINYLAYIYRNLKDYKTAILLYHKLKGPIFRFEARIGTLRCAFESGDTLLSKKTAALLVSEASVETTDLFNLYRIASNLYSTRQFEYFFKLDPRLMEKSVRENPKSISLSMIYNHIGAYYWYRNDFENSLSSYQKALLSVLPHENSLNIFSDLNFKECLSYPSLIENLNARGEAFYQLSKQQRDHDKEIKYLGESYKNLNLSIEQMYKYKLQLSSDEQKYIYSSLKSQRYPNIIKVCLELYNLTGDIQYHYKAFQFAEQGRAAIMLSMLRGNDAQRIGLIPSGYKALEDSVNLQVAMINQKLKTLGKDNPEVYTLNARLDILANQRSDFEKLYKAQYPSYYQLKYSTEVTSVPQIQRQLGDDECLTEYLLSRNFLISFYIDKRNFLIKTDTLHKTNLAQLAESFYQRNSRFSPDDYRVENVKAFAADAQLLYNILLRPFEDKIGDKKIIVVADNGLQKIPFESLLTGPPDDFTGYRSLPYLLRRNTVYYAPSATFLQELRKRPEVNHRARLLAVNPVYPDLTNRDSVHNLLLAVRSDTSFIASLPYASGEVSFAHAIAGGRLLSGKKASETRFKKMAGNFDIIHLATHGIINEDSVFDSEMIFAGADGENDGFLYNYEVYNLKHTSQLVILSACNTGNGKSYGGEGVISTGRGFLSSGSRSVLMTMWQVNDKSSFELMKGFYIHLKGRLSVSDALVKSKLDFLDRADKLHSHPYFWSGYISYGDASFCLKIGNYSRMYGWGIVIILLIITGGYFIIRRKGREKG